MNIFKKINIHPFFYLVIIICTMSGLFKEFLIFLSLIIVHELGHILNALLYKWQIEKIVILPFGGLTIFNEKINRPLKEEFLITISGPLAQIGYCYLFRNIITYNHLLETFNNNLLVFNLLPIIPLDGSKLLNIFLCKIFPFKKTIVINIILSVITIILFISKITSLTFVLILFLLLNKIINEYKIRNHLFNKFLFERYLYNFKFKKMKFIKSDNVDKMYKDYQHVFYQNNKYIQEKELISRKYRL